MYLFLDKHVDFLFQIEHQLNALLSHVEVVLGKGWENHVEGQQLKNDGESFRLKLNTQEIFDDWQRRVRKIGSCEIFQLAGFTKMLIVTQNREGIYLLLAHNSKYKRNISFTYT